MAKTYDTKSFDLAEYFIRDDPNIDNIRAHFLAIEIQTAVEDWCEQQSAPCYFCGKPIGKGDHSKCVLF